MALRTQMSLCRCASNARTQLEYNWQSHYRSSRSVHLQQPHGRQRMAFLPMKSTILGAYSARVRLPIILKLSSGAYLASLSRYRTGP
eukprot:2288103-Rhodomonas_salina.2